MYMHERNLEKVQKLQFLNTDNYMGRYQKYFLNISEKN